MVAEMVGDKSVSWDKIIDSMRPRPDGRGNGMPIWPLCIQYQASMRPRPDGRGNALPERQNRLPSRASMRPRPDGRGNNEKRDRSPMNDLASMRPRPDGRGNLFRDMTHRQETPSFNEAATRWSRKYCSATSAPCRPSELQ